jgi:hypothetical protein
MKYIFLTILLISLNNCSHPQINHKDNRLSISNQETILVEGKGTELYKNSIHLSHINIYQYIYSINNRLITYEYIKATDGYRFTKGIKRSVGIIFDTNAYELEFTKANLYFFKLTPKNETIYLIVENINSSALKLVYGFDKQTYEKIKKALKENKALKNTSVPSKKVAEPEKELKSHLKTKWSPKVVILDKLVSKPFGRAARGGR